MNNKKQSNQQTQVLDYLISLDDEIEFPSWLAFWKELIGFPSPISQTKTDMPELEAVLYTLIGKYVHDETIKMSCAYTKGKNFKRFVLGFWKIPDGDSEHPFNIQFIKHFSLGGPTAHYVHLVKDENNFGSAEFKDTENPELLSVVPSYLHTTFTTIRSEFVSRFHWM